MTPLGHRATPTEAPSKGLPDTGSRGLHTLNSLPYTQGAHTEQGHPWGGGRGGGCMASKQMPEPAEVHTAEGVDKGYGRG